MARVRSIVWIVYAIMLGSCAIALDGGFASHRGIVAIFAPMSFALAVIPASRKAALVGCVLSLGAAVAAPATDKYFGPLGFAAFGMLTVATTAAYSQRWARWMLYPFAFIEAAWLGSLIRQTVFEIATAGHPTEIMDGCTQAFLPLIFGILLAFMGAVTAIAAYLPQRLRDAPYAGMPPADPFATRTGPAWFTGTIVAGAAMGVLVWRDWQISNPCL